MRWTPTRAQGLKGLQSTLRFPPGSSARVPQILRNTCMSTKDTTDTTGPLSAEEVARRMDWGALRADLSHVLTADDYERRSALADAFCADVEAAHNGVLRALATERQARERAEERAARAEARDASEWHRRAEAAEAALADMQARYDEFVAEAGAQAQAEVARADRAEAALAQAEAQVAVKGGWEQGKADALAAVRAWARDRRADETRGGSLMPDGGVMRMFKDGVLRMFAEGAENAAAVVERDLRAALSSDAGTALLAERDALKARVAVLEEALLEAADGIDALADVFEGVVAKAGPDDDDMPILYNAITRREADRLLGARDAARAALAGTGAGELNPATSPGHTDLTVAPEDEEDDPVDVRCDCEKPRPSWGAYGFDTCGKCAGWIDDAPRPTDEPQGGGA